MSKKKPDTSPVIQGDNRDETGKFKKGHSGNPNGRPPKEHSITDTFRQMMDEQPEVKRELAGRIMTAALQGDMNAARLIWTYLDGMPKQRMEVEDVTPKQVSITYLKPGDAKDDDRTQHPVRTDGETGSGLELPDGSDHN